jgi:hypothetical protein
MNIFIDTEFTDFAEHTDCELISIGFSANNGMTFYGERNDFNRSTCSAFVKTVVLPQLGKEPDRQFDKAALAKAVRAWLNQFEGPEPVFICYDYVGDYLLLWDLLDLDVPRWLLTKDVWAQIDDLVSERLIRDMFDGYQHHALHDAICNRLAFRPDRESK